MKAKLFYSIFKDRKPCVCRAFLFFPRLYTNIKKPVSSGIVRFAHSSQQSADLTNRSYATFMYHHRRPYQHMNGEVMLQKNSSASKVSSFFMYLSLSSSAKSSKYGISSLLSIPFAFLYIDNRSITLS